MKFPIQINLSIALIVLCLGLFSCQKDIPTVQQTIPELQEPSLCFGMHSMGASTHYYFAGDSVYFSNCSENATQFQWLINDTLQSTDSNYTHEFLVRGRQYITLRAISGADTNSRTQSLMIQAPLPKAMKFTKISLLEWPDTDLNGILFDSNSQPDITFVIFQNGIELFRSNAVRHDPWRYSMIVFDQDGGLPYYSNNLIDDIVIKFYDFDNGGIQNWDEMLRVSIKPIRQHLYYGNVYEEIAPHSYYHAKIEWDWIY